MPAYYNDIRELIGNTPLLKINHIQLPPKVNVFAKLEFCNPGGSVKDRMGVFLIKKARESGLLKPGSTIIEATAGNTGIGVALAAINSGYKVILIVPDKFSIEKQILMKALGATIINTPREIGIKGALAKAAELLKTIPDSLSLGQFDNKDNPLIHYQTTGPEIYAALDGKIDYFIAGAGTGGTFSGVARYLKEQNPDIQAILADPVGSTLGGGTEDIFEIEGIGNNFVPSTMDMQYVDQVIKVSDEEAFVMSRELAAKEGLIVGSSSGAAMAAVLKLAAKISSGNIVTILPDRGDRYFSKNLYTPVI